VLLALAWVSVVLEGRSALGGVVRAAARVHGNALRVAAACAVGALMLLTLAMMASVLIALVVPLVGGQDLALITAITANVMVACVAVAVPFAAALLYTLFTQLQALHEAEAGLRPPGAAPGPPAASAPK
jgi:hypothetical protein